MSRRPASLAVLYPGVCESRVRVSCGILDGEAAQGGHGRLAALAVRVEEGAHLVRVRVRVKGRVRVRVRARVRVRIRVILG